MVALPLEGTLTSKTHIFTSIKFFRDQEPTEQLPLSVSGVPDATPQKFLMPSMFLRCLRVFLMSSFSNKGGCMHTMTNIGALSGTFKFHIKTPSCISKTLLPVSEVHHTHADSSWCRRIRNLTQDIKNPFSRMNLTRYGPSVVFVGALSPR